jgi:hypothetical protein
VREELKELSGTRWTFRGVFVRLGRKQYRDHPPQPTLLLRDIELVSSPGRIVSDHLWFNLTAQFAAFNPQPGDRFQFDARARIYRKRRRDDYDEDGERWTLDYKLSHPTKVKKVEESRSRGVEKAAQTCSPRSAVLRPVRVRATEQLWLFANSE